MHFASGPPKVYSLIPHVESADERVVAVSASPVGNCTVVLSQRRLHLWTCTNDVIYLGSFPIPSTTDDDDPATQILWHPRGQHLVVATLQRRVIFFEVSLDIKNAEVLAPTYHEHSLCVSSTAPRVRFAKEERLEAGIVTSLTMCGPNCFFACTTSGVVCVIGWFQQKLLHTWSYHSLSKEICFTATGDEAANKGVDGGVELSCKEVLTGTIIDACHASPLKLTALLLSSGYVVLARSKVGSDFTKDDIAFSGKCSAAPCAARVAINSKHMLVMVATHAGEVACKRIDEDLSLRPFWNGLKCLKSVRRIGPISDLQWSPDEEVLCVGFYHLGVVLVHYSGVCVYSSLQAPYTQHCIIEGCASFSWSSHSHRLFLIEPQGKNLTALDFNQIVSSPSGDTKGCFTPIVAFDNERLHLAGHSSVVGDLTLNDLVKVHPQYAAENYPLTHGAVSPDGAVVVLAGRHGFVLFDRFTRRWRAFRDKSLEREMTCVARPLWLNSVAVVMPVRMVRSRTYALRVYAHGYLDASALLTHLPLERMPLKVCECHGEGHDTFLIVVDSSNSLLVWRCIISSRRPSSTPAVGVLLEFIKRIKLPSSFHNPVSITAIHPSRLHPLRTTHSSLPKSMNGNETSLPHALFILRGSHALVALDLGTSSEVPGVSLSFTTLCSKSVYCLWIDSTVPMDGNAILLFSENGVDLFHLLSSRDGMDCFPEVYKYSVENFDSDYLPVGLSTRDGCLLTASRASDVFSFVTDVPSIASPRIAVKPLLYNYRVLTALTRLGSPSADVLNGKRASCGAIPFSPLVWGDSLFYWLERMRSNGTFVPNMDYFLHTLIDETPPAGIDHLDRRAAVQATVSLLRRYSEFYGVVVSCVRKEDVSRWRVVLDVLGSPVDFFRECVENQRFEEAAHLLRVIMLDGTPSDNGASAESLANAMTCAAQLLIFAVRQRNVHLVHDLLRFTALLHVELVMPTVEGSESANHDMWTRLWSVVGFQRDSTSASVLEKEPLLFLTSEELQCGSSNSCDTMRRRCAIEFIFRNYPEVRQAVECVATESLLSGHLAMLREILQELFLSLPQFVKVTTRKMTMETGLAFIGANMKEEGGLEDEDKKNMKEEERADGGARVSAGCAHMRGLFGGIHDEFGLPRSLRCMESYHHVFLSASAAGTEGTCADTTLWTTAQSHLYSTPGVAEALLNLRGLYAAWNECVLAINVVLMNEADVMQQLLNCPTLAQTLHYLVACPENLAYVGFVRRCVDGSLPAQLPLPK
ncbi:hypothetical protein DQ04_02391050 [Trypanosoma grayi]|uniref:hypothetical protein n=1 Tax=Trypanosoma grayi TaxID=71804 RepID=UPI0004F45B35|nr:hypothetical protein DQ04_02391050 [Trypanosoma grayi]KEG11659.1 hypothetical protein DQ04_02391050 [Trypanosoma grayi]